MIVVVFILAFIASYFTLYIVSFFSGENNDPISILKASLIIWGLSIILNTFQITGIIGMGISTIISMFTFMKFLGFEPMPSFFAGLIYSAIYSFLLILIFSIVL